MGRLGLRRFEEAVAAELANLLAMTAAQDRGATPAPQTMGATGSNPSIGLHDRSCPPSRNAQKCRQPGGSSATRGV
jgi:hypothetical protein